MFHHAHMGSCIRFLCKRLVYIARTGGCHSIDCSARHSRYNFYSYEGCCKVSDHLQPDSIDFGAIPGLNLSSALESIASTYADINTPKLAPPSVSNLTRLIDVHGTSIVSPLDHAFDSCHSTLRTRLVSRDCP